MTSSVAVFEAAKWVNQCILQNHEWKPEKNRKYKNQRMFCINLHLTDGLVTEFTVC